MYHCPAEQFIFQTQLSLYFDTWSDTILVACPATLLNVFCIGEDIGTRTAYVLNCIKTELEMRVVTLKCYPSISYKDYRLLLHDQ